MITSRRLLTGSSVRERHRGALLTRPLYHADCRMWRLPPKFDLLKTAEPIHWRLLHS